MSLLVLAAAASFACASPFHHDGDAIRCAGMGKAMRLHGIDAPEMPGACRPGRNCTPGDPYAARDALAALTRGRAVQCRQVDTDHYGRRVVDCTADGENLGCAMVAAGMAVERYGRLDCGRRERRSVAATPATRRQPPAVAARAEPRYHAAADAPAVADPGGSPLVDSLAAAVAGPDALRLLVFAWLAFINAAGLAAMASDKRRAGAARHRRVRRIPEAQLLLLAALGGSGGAIAAQQLFRHKTVKQPFAGRLRAIVIAQLVLVAVVAVWVRQNA